MKFFNGLGIGNDIKYCSDKKLDYIYYSILGGELHTKMRLRPVLDFLSKKRRTHGDLTILELGCGFGINAFEISKIIENFQYDGFDLSEEAITQGKKIIEKKALQKNIHLFCEDATKYNFQNEKKYDLILLIDFLEHVDNPKKIVSTLAGLAHSKTVFLVSVPTRNYKKYFGEAFHQKVGHVHPGYSFFELNELFSFIGYKEISHRYSTGIPARYLCSLYYKFNFKNRYMSLLKNSLLGRLSFLDFLNDEKRSCSLFVVYGMK